MRGQTACPCIDQLSVDGKDDDDDGLRRQTSDLLCACRYVETHRCTEVSEADC